MIYQEADHSKVQVLHGIRPPHSQTVLDVLRLKGIPFSELNQLGLPARMEMLVPEPAKLEEVIRSGHLREIFPSMARLYRIYGNLPTADEVLEELHKGLGLDSLSREDIAEGFRQREIFFSLLQPEMEEYVSHWWMIQKQHGSDITMDDMLMEAHVVLHHAFIFNYHWDDLGGNPIKYLNGSLRMYYIGYTTTENRRRDEVDLYGLDADAISNRSMFDLDSSIRSDIHPKSYTRDKPPFIKDGTSVFTGLNFDQITAVIHGLKKGDQYLVLSLLGYIPYANYHELASALGYSYRRFFENRGRNYLTTELWEERSRLFAAGLSANYGEMTMHQLVQEIGDIRVSDVLKEEGRIPPRTTPYQIEIRGLDMDVLANKLLYQQLELDQRQLLDLLRLRSGRDGEYLDVGQIAQIFGTDIHNLRLRIRDLVLGFRKGPKITSLRKRFQELADKPNFLPGVRDSGRSSRRDTALFLGDPIYLLPIDDRVDISGPMDASGISEKLGERRENTEQRLVRLEKRLRRRLS